MNGQVQTGTPPFGSFSGGPFDTIDNANLNVHFAVPVFTRAGRGTSFSYTMAYDSSVWTPVKSGNNTAWVPTANWGWAVVTQPQFGTITAGNVYYASATCPNSTPPNGNTVTVNWIIWSNLSYVDQFGTSHLFVGSEATNWQQPPGDNGAQCGGGESTNTNSANDGSGLTLTTGNEAGVNFPVATVTARNGVVISPTGSANATYVDTNGNQITGFPGNPAKFYDTLSSSTPALTVTGVGSPSSPYTFTFTGPQGNVNTIFNYKNYPIQTKFGCSGVTEYSSSSQPLLDNIQLPNGSISLCTNKVLVLHRAR